LTGEANGDSPADKLADPLLPLGALARFGAFSSSRPSSAAGLLLALIRLSYELIACSSPAAAAADGERGIAVLAWAAAAEEATSAAWLLLQQLLVPALGAMVLGCSENP
jgi:hypothetical protein